MSVTLECRTRTEKTNPRALRRQGLIPANLYGHKGAESVSLVVPQKEAIRVLRSASVNNTLIQLTVSDLNWSGRVLIREVQTHPWKRELYHISFFCPSGQKPVEVVVPLKIVGQAVGLTKGGILEQMLTEVKVRCLPERIPDFIEADISGVDIGKNFCVGNLTPPEGVTVLDEPQKTILTIVPPRKL
ncbi:MAG: 50S ribosomal protein L25/general stress protein Ctc [Geminocystis sp.]|nr:50S ribosomal protein L25/general stress protein Ctc [Geminocystis sp.]MCS7147858.1 50S ribosomal protein L25/general stress protein Ctc [Geminocystis sp.]MCX8079099.1 50S ribosomal protein L25/general stress protein Ctc [Geminocystis sp.]MDW8117056.1 50S ribosomal protein L25/general stress protein Ctc [Geminocystis sp.]MDW8462406.1 50S ribosomal protein L25/general stress protein Ctc [Geminocystis sp.]